MLERLAENGEDRTVNIFTVSFFGHRIIPEFREAEDRVEALVHALLLEKEYVEFLVGRGSWSDGTEILTRSFPPLSNARSGLYGMTTVP